MHPLAKKHTLQAPASEDREPPRWSRGGDLRAAIKPGLVHLTWEKGEDNEGIYGYDVFRSEDGGPFQRLAATKIPSLFDQTATSDVKLAYRVQAYDFAGLRTPPSNVVEVELPAALGEVGG